MRETITQESHERFTLVRPRITDFDIQGILNSKQYVEFVTEARIEQMARYYKIPIEVYFSRNQTWVLSRFEISYKRAITFPSSFFVHTEVLAIDGPRCTVAFSFLSANKEITHAEGEAHYYLLDNVTRKSIPISEDDRRIYLEQRDA